VTLDPAPLIIGVLNVTPDSFSDGGRYLSADDAIAHAHEMFAQGASIVDIGGESTRPGAAPVPLSVEQDRVMPVIRALAGAGLRTSIDTLHASTARQAVEAGVAFINDVSGGTHDPDMLTVAAEASATRGVHFIISHWRGIPDPQYLRSDYCDVVADVRDAIAERVERAVVAGVDRAHIIVDPGLGFDKTGAQGWRLLSELGVLRELGYPVLVGASRKRMIAEALAGPDGDGIATSPEERDLATAVVSALAAQSGVWGVRVHDVAGSAQALAVARAWGAPVRDPHPPAEDRITLTGLEVFAHHGVFDFERAAGQRFTVDAEVSVDLRSAASSDELGRTVHYGELADAIVRAVARDPVDLIETVAERVAAVALGFAGVRRATVTVHKPDAPIDAEFADVAVTVVRSAHRSTP